MLLKTSSIAQIRTNQLGKQRKFYQKMDLFLQSQPDLYLILSDKIYPSHKKVLNNSQYIKKIMDDDQKIIVIDLQINQNSFELSLGYLYSRELNFQRSSQIFEILSVSKQMGIVSLFQQILDDFQQNFDEYNFFKLYSAALKWNIQQLKQRCEQELMKLSYQQMNINRLDLLEMDKQALQQMIRNHQKLKVNKAIDGISRRQLQSIIFHYNKFHHLNLNIDELLTIKEQYYDFERKQKMSLSCKSKKHQSKAIVKRKSISCNLQSQNDDDKEKEQIGSEKVSAFQKKQPKSQKDKRQDKKQDKLSKCIQVRDKYLDMQCVTSPVVNLGDTQLKGISFDNFSSASDDKFMNIQSQNTFGYISQRNLLQEQDSIQLTPMQLQQKKVINQKKLKAIPQMRKDVMF